jgi:RimJ/RimL family protein N-acetyltransferase
LTATHTELVIRPITGRDELDLFCQIPYLLNDELADDLDSGHRRPEWLWMALRGDRLVARAAWWKMSDHTAPGVLDIFDIDDGCSGPERLDTGVRLLREAAAAVIPAGTTPPEYSRFVSADWRDHPAARRAVEDRMKAAERTGARLFVERLRLEWRPGTPIPARTGRLAFVPVSDHDELITLMTAVMDGTLDAHGRRDLTQMSPAQAAARHYQGELAQYRSPREWWQIARLPGGAPAGFVIPAHNGYNPIIAYIAVLPAYRGNGYIDELLAEGTRILAAQDVPRIRASTDLGNVPMAAAFRRAGWAQFGRQINMTWD